ncbi:MAG: hypothetical protein KDA61_15555, partial [Planctomycetales bacterium]|nr:hypothetical protein [Planctomycetales bacterium]
DGSPAFDGAPLLGELGPFDEKDLNDQLEEIWARSTGAWGYFQDAKRMNQLQLLFREARAALIRSELLRPDP